MRRLSIRVGFILFWHNSLWVIDRRINECWSLRRLMDNEAVLLKDHQLLEVFRAKRAKVVSTNPTMYFETLAPDELLEIEHARRASFIRANLRDDTTYVYPSLRGAQLENEPNDIGAVAVAVLKVEQSGVRLFTAGQLSFAEPSLRREFEGVVQRGLAELGVLLRQEQIL